MPGIQEKLEKIASQADKWIWFSKISPVLLAIIMFAVFGISQASNPVMLYISWAGFFLACIAWWIWVIKVIYEMTELFSVVFRLITNIRNDLKEVKKDLDFTSND